MEHRSLAAASGAEHRVPAAAASEAVRHEPTLSPVTSMPTAPLYTQEVSGFAGVSGYGVASTTSGEGGRSVIVSNAESFAYWIKKGKKQKPLTVQVVGMIDMSNLKNSKNETAYMHSASSYITIVGVGKNSGIVSGGVKIKGFDLCKEEPNEGSDHCLEPDSQIPPPGVEPEGNVIIRNMVFKDCPQDCINMQHFAHHIWIDHCEFSRPNDGAIDMTRGTDLVTISWNKFQNTNKTMLVGHDETNAKQDIGRLRVTLHHNFFYGTNSRHPRVRYAEPVHLYNNYFLGVKSYGVSAQMGSGVIVEANYFENVEVPTTTDVGTEPGRIIQRFNTYQNSKKLDSAEKSLNSLQLYRDFNLFNSRVFYGNVPTSRDSGFIEEPYQYYNYRMDDPITLPDLVPTLAGTGVVA